jgi:hypothetical protein
MEEKNQIFLPKKGHFLQLKNIKNKKNIKPHNIF